MGKIEVEHRGLISKEKFNELNQFFQKNGKPLGSKKRFSLVYNTSHKSVREVRGELLDLKLRITNKRPELAVKYGKWSGKDARREFNFKLDEGQFDEMLELLQILGYSRYVIMANTKYDFMYKDIEFSLVDVKGWGYYFEAEIIADESGIEVADAKLEQEIKKLGLSVLEEEAYYDLLDDLNNRPGCRVDFKEVEFKDIKLQYTEYF